MPLARRFARRFNKYETGSKSSDPNGDSPARSWREEALEFVGGTRNWESKSESGSGKKASGMVGLGLGFWYSSTKPELQEGQRISPAAEGEMLTVCSHWWQKYICGPPSATATPLEDIFAGGLFRGTQFLVHLI